MNIKDECQIQYDNIEKSQNRLEELRNICKHEDTFIGNWSWRIGCIDEAIICSDCNKLIKNLGHIPADEVKKEKRNRKIDMLLKNN